MYLRRSINIFISKFNLVFKLLFYFVLVIVIMSAIAVSIIQPAFKALTAEIEDTQIVENIKAAAELIIRGDFQTYSEGFDALEASYLAAKDLIVSNMNKLYKVYILIFILGVIAKYLICLSYIPFVDVVNQFMNSDVDSKVVHRFVENGKRSLLYSLFEVLILVPVDAVIFLLVIGFVSLMSPILNIFTLPFAVAFGLALYMLRVCLFAGWLPAIVYDNMPVLSALKYSFKTVKLRFKKTYSMFLTVSVFCMSFYTIFGVSTLGLGYFIGLPMIIMFYRVMELVAYYNMNGHRYYLDHDTIVEPRI